MGIASFRRVVILGDFVSRDKVKLYSQKYQAAPWNTVSRGWWGNSWGRVRRALSRDQVVERILANELASLTYTAGEWFIYVPEDQRRLLLSALKFVPDGAIKVTRGHFILLGDRPSPKIENEVLRITDGGFDVRYQEE
jgi:hypothetical protein